MPDAPGELTEDGELFLAHQLFLSCHELPGALLHRVLQISVQAAQFFLSLPALSDVFGIQQGLLHLAGKDGVEPPFPVA